MNYCHIGDIQWVDFGVDSDLAADSLEHAASLIGEPDFIIVGEFGTWDPGSVQSIRELRPATNFRILYVPWLLGDSWIVVNTWNQRATGSKGA